MNHPLQRSIRTANIFNLIQSILGGVVFVMLPFAVPPAGSPLPHTPVYQIVLILIFLGLVTVTAWNNQRELDLIPKGRAPRAFFHLSSVLVITGALTLFALEIGSHGRLASLPNLFMTLAIAVNSVYNLRIAARYKRTLTHESLSYLQ